MPAITRALSQRASFALQVSIVVLLLAASSAPTPLYAVYRAEWGFAPVTLTVVFGVYAVAVLVALVTVGRLSDHVGRRPVLLAAVAMQVVALAIFATASDVTALLAARIVQGFSTGIGLGALGAGLLDINKDRGTRANGLAPLAGTAMGSLLSGVVVQLLPAPTHLVYVALMVTFGLTMVGIALMPETSTKASGAVASLRPRFAAPRTTRAAMLAAMPALIAVWSLAGFYASLGPTLVQRLSGSTSYVAGALSLAILSGAAALTIHLLRALPPRPVMMFGTAALLVGAASTLVMVEIGSTVGFFAATVVAGVGFGAGFQGGLRSVLPLARPHERAGLLSTMYAVCYLAFGLPAVVAGAAVDSAGVLRTAAPYLIVVMVLAALALTGPALHSRQPSTLAVPDPDEHIDQAVIGAAACPMPRVSAMTAPSGP
jgi:predicted MFS family arabinose efflux permease